MQELTGEHDLPFGGKLCITAGDFHQLLPIIRHGSVHEILANTVKQAKCGWNDNVCD